MTSELASAQLLTEQPSVRKPGSIYSVISIASKDICSE